MRTEEVLKRAEEASGNYTSAGGEYYFDGYAQEPIKLLALRRDIAETLEALGKAVAAKPGQMDLDIELLCKAGA